MSKYRVKGKAVKIRFDSISYFKNALSITTGVSDEATMCFQEDNFYLQKDNKEDNVSVDIIIYKDSIKKYYINPDLLKGDSIPFIGFKSKDFIKTLGKVGKPQVYDIILNKCSSDKIRLIDTSTGKESGVRIIQTDIQDNEELEEYLYGGEYEYNIKVDVKELSAYFNSIKSIECTKAKIIAYPTYMKIKGIVEKEVKMGMIFGDKKPYYYCEDDDIKYPIKYTISQKYILMLTKIHTVTPGYRAEFFFFKNKLVIKSGLNTNGSIIFKFKKEEE